ncbi:MAG TPA: ChaN family lipoprotein [Blastocatellia bacterium]|nr:ChaN family lipoprotein [Blastocatellia bacterium]
MSTKSVAAKNAVLLTAIVMIVAAAALVASLTNESLARAKSPQNTGRPNLRLPDEAAGIDEIARTLVSAFDQVDIVALGEAHRRRLDSDLRIAVVRDPEFAKKVRSILVEFGSTTEQATLDRYIRGENVSRTELEQVWKTTEAGPHGVWDFPIYADFFAAVREVNSKLPANARIRVFGGDPGPSGNRSRDSAAISILKEQVLQKRGKALVIYGAGHFYRTAGDGRDFHSVMGDIGIARTIEVEYPGRTFVVIPLGYRLVLPPGVAAGIDPDYQKFDRALKTQVRPVLVPLQSLPFRDFTAEEFLGGTVTTCRGAGGCVSVFKDSPLTLGQIADACVYVGPSVADVDTKARPAR